MAAATPCRKCGAPLSRSDGGFCSMCGTPASVVLPVRHDDAIREFAHHESVLQNYRAMFIVTETFAASIAATKASDPQSLSFLLMLAALGIAWLAIWIIVTTLRARVVRFFEEHDEDGALMRYHHEVESVAHRAGFWFFTVLFPASFAVFWFGLLLLAYHLL